MKKLADYQDLLHKAAFYREQIGKSLIKKGVTPDDLTIRERLDRIDLYLALFKAQQEKPETTFDAKRYNESMELIYQDLLFLYRIVYDLTVKRYHEAKLFIDTHLDELERLASELEYRSNMEFESSVLGDTIFFQSSGFSMQSFNNTVRAELGTIEAKKGAQLAFLISGKNFDSADAVFGVRKPGDPSYKRIPPYEPFQNTWTVPGKQEINTYAFTIDQDILINSSFRLPVHNVKIDPGARYIVMAGENMAAITESDRTRLVEMDANNTIVVSGPAETRFFIHRGTFAYFQFSKEPAAKNFKGHSVEDLNPYHEFVIQNDGGAFAFSVTTDGKVFAEKNEAAERNGGLYYPEATEAKTFLLDEIKPGEEETYELIVDIRHTKEALPDINYVAVKELNSLGVMA